MSRNKTPVGWEEKNIDSIAEIISGTTPKTSNPEYWNGDIVWITPEDLSLNEEVYLKNSLKKITRKGLEKSSIQLISKNSVVMSSRAPIGYLAIITTNYTTNQGCKSFKSKDISSKFLYYNLLHNMPLIKQWGRGTTFSEISKTQLKKFIIKIPLSKIEQNKIAQNLIIVDNTIDKTKKINKKNKIY